MGEVNLPPEIGQIIGDLGRRLSELERRIARVPTCTLATRPAASSVTVGSMVFVSDAVDGQRFQGSDGTNWKTLG